MNPITKISGPLDASAFINNSAMADGAKTLAEVVQVINKTSEIIDGLTEVADDLDGESDTRSAADVALGARMDTAEGEIDVLQAANLSNEGMIQAIDARLEDVEFAVSTAYEEVTATTTILATTTKHMVNFTGTSGLQDVTLGPTMTDFTAGKSWVFVCNNADGVQVSSSNWAHSSLTGGVANVNLLVGDMAVVGVVDFAGTKKWSMAVLRGIGGYRAATAGGGDLGSVDDDDRYIWVDRTGDTGTRDLYLPELGSGTTYFNGMREITLALYGTRGSGTFVVHVAAGSTDTFIDGSTSFTMEEGSACRLIGNDNGRWAIIGGKA